MYLNLQSPLHIKRRKIQNQVLHDINSQLEQIMKHKKGVGSDSLQSFIGEACLCGLHQLFSFSLLHNRSRATMRLWQSHTFKREQCSLKPVYEGAGPDTSVSDRLPIVGSGNEVLPQGLQCNHVVAFSAPIAETSDIGHDCRQESVHLSLLKRQKQQVRTVPYLEWEVRGRHWVGSAIQLRNMKTTFMAGIWIISGALLYIGNLFDWEWKHYSNLPCLYVCRLKICMFVDAHDQRVNGLLSLESEIVSCKISWVRRNGSINCCRSLIVIPGCGTNCSCWPSVAIYWHSHWLRRFPRGHLWIF